MSSFVGSLWMLSSSSQVSVTSNGILFNTDWYFRILGTEFYYAIIMHWLRSRIGNSYLLCQRILSAFSPLLFTLAELFQRSQVSSLDRFQQAHHSQFCVVTKNLLQNCHKTCNFQIANLYPDMNFLTCVYLCFFNLGAVEADVHSP